MTEIDWMNVTGSLEAARKARQLDSWAARRDFLKRMGINRDTVRRHRLREQDGLSEDAWWVAVRAAMQCRKNNGVRMLGKKVGQ